MRPLVNRWLIISEPLFDQTEVTADLADLPIFSAVKQNHAFIYILDSTYNVIMDFRQKKTITKTRHHHKIESLF